MFESLVPTNVQTAPVAQKPPRDRLARHVMDRFAANTSFRTSSGAEDKLIQAVRAYNLIPSQAEEALFERLGVAKETFDPLVRSRVNHIAALLTRVFVNQGKTYSCEETPVPEVPESVTAAVYAEIFVEFAQLMEATRTPFDERQATDYAFRRAGDVFSAQKAWAAERAKRMDRLVDDILTEGGFPEVAREAVMQMCKTGTGVVIGPCETVENGIRQGTGKSIGEIVFERKLMRKQKFFCPDTLDCFPSAGAKRAEDGDLCVRVRYSIPELSLYAKKSFASGDRKAGREADGWDPKAVARVLYRVRNNGTVPAVSLPIDALIEEAASDTGSYGRKLCAEGVRYFGSLSGEMLRYGGVLKDSDGGDIENDMWYEADVTVIDDEVVCARVCDSAVGRPVMKCVCYADPSSWFGGSFAYMLRNVQAVMNIVMASLKKQLQMASGPMLVWNDFDSFVGKENPDIFKARPWANLFRAANPYAPAGNQKPVDMVEFNTRIAEMLKVVEAVNAMADDYLGFPRHMFGTGSASGAIRTARGMAMMQEASNINASWVIGNVDSQLVRPGVKKLVAWINMRYPDPSVKGDVEVVAHGALGQVLEAAKRDEAQNMYAMVSRDMFLQQSLGPAKVLALFRNMLETMGYPNPDSILPSAQRIEEMEMLNRIGQMQSALPSPQQAPLVGGDGALDFQTRGGTALRGAEATPTGLPRMSGTEVSSPEPVGMTDTSDVKRRRGAA